MCCRCITAATTAAAAAAAAAITTTTTQQLYQPHGNNRNQNNNTICPLPVSLIPSFSSLWVSLSLYLSNLFSLRVSQHLFPPLFHHLSFFYIAPMLLLPRNLASSLSPMLPFETSITNSQASAYTCIVYTRSASTENMKNNFYKNTIFVICLSVFPNEGRQCSAGHVLFSPIQRKWNWRLIPSIQKRCSILVSETSEQTKKESECTLSSMTISICQQWTLSLSPLFLSLSLSLSLSFSLSLSLPYYGKKWKKSR